MSNSQIVRTSPRISINKLGEYLTARPARRRAILHDQKFLPPYKAARYEHAKRAIVEYFMKGFDATILEAHVSRLRLTSARSQHEQQNLQLSIEAILAFSATQDHLDLRNLTATAGRPNPAKLIMSGVRVSVCPELLLTRSGRKGRVTRGVVKLLFAKSRPVTPEAASYITTLLRQYCEQSLQFPYETALKDCVLVDVFRGRLHTPPRSHKLLLEDLKAACQEIAIVWDSIV